MPKRSPGSPSCTSRRGDLDASQGACCRLAPAPAPGKEPIRRSRRRWPRCTSPSRPRAVGELAPLEKALAANPDDHQARFDLALALNAKGERDAAADQSAGDHQARPQMERRGGAQATAAILRSLGPDGPGGGRPARAQTCRRSGSDRRGREGAPAERGRGAMKLNRSLRPAADMPATIPLFPLAGALLLPRRPIQLKVFEPRYLAMLDDALSGERLIGMIQPSERATAAGTGAGALSASAAPAASCNIAEIGDGRCFLTLMGVARFHLASRTRRRQRLIAWRAPTIRPFAERLPRGRGRGRGRSRRPPRRRCANSPRPTGQDRLGATSTRPPTRRWSTAWRC